MQLFYSTQIEKNQIILDEVESRHCLKVLRKNLGDTITVTNGTGNLYEAEISGIQKKNVVAEIIKDTFTSENPSNFCHIAIAPTKNIDRFEWFLEKTTEIGISKITPLYCENSERTSIRTDRLEKILVSAMKQSLKTYKPILEPAITFNQFITDTASVKHKFITHCQNEMTNHLYNEYEKGKNTIILIGPEGDFSQSEVAKAKEFDYKEVSLGESRLRTETAGVVACHAVILKNTLTGNLPG